MGTSARAEKPEVQLTNCCVLGESKYYKKTQSSDGPSTFVNLYPGAPPGSQ